MREALFLGKQLVIVAGKFIGISLIIIACWALMIGQDPGSLPFF